MRLDRVTVRRMLVDEGYLRRDRYGAAYVLGASSPAFGYAPSIRSLDLHGLVTGLEQLRAERKQAALDAGLSYPRGVRAC